MDQKDVMNILVCRDVGTKSTANATGTTIDAYDDLKDGEIVVVNPHNVVIGATEILTDAIVAKYGFKFIVRKGTELFHSDLMKIDNIRSCDGIADSAAAAQVSFIGYNGTSGSIEVNDNVPYVPRFIFRWNTRGGEGNYSIIDGVYKSGASAVQSDICIGITDSLDNAMSRQGYTEPIVLNAICSATHVAANDFDGNLIVTQGSKVLSAASSGQYGGGTDIAVGDYIRIDADGSDAVTVADSVYEVKELSGTTTKYITLDRPVKESSRTDATGNQYNEVISAATGDAANWGIKATGQTRQFDPGKYRDSVVEFEIGLNDSFGATGITYNTAAARGIGTYNQIAQLEWELKGNLGLVYAEDHLQPNFTLVANHTGTDAMYDQIAISWFDDKPTNVVDVSQSAKQLILASVTGFADGEPFDLVCDALAALGWDLSAVSQ